MIIVAAKAIKLEPSWIGKHTLFRWPFAWLFRAMGGILAWLFIVQAVLIGTIVMSVLLAIISVNDLVG